jgi:hypothetical protein
MNGQYIQDYEYNIAGPHAVGDRGSAACSLSGPHHRTFPNDSDLTALNAVSYAGVPLLKSDGTVFGHLSALDTKYLELPTYLESVFRIFADFRGSGTQPSSRESGVREANCASAEF